MAAPKRSSIPSIGIHSNVRGISKMTVLLRHIRLFWIAVLILGVGSVFCAIPPGVRPVGKDGTPLNLDFEDGTLKDWKAEGNAFQGQPIKGDTVFPRRNDMRSNHQGNYWIGGFEKVGDDPKGTLTSATFKVTRPWASFLVAGGPWPATRVELVDAGTQMAFFKVSGYESERPKFDNELDPANSVAEAPPADVVPFAGLSPQEAS